RRFYPKRLTYVRLTMYTHFTFTLMAHFTSCAIRGSVSCSRTLRQGIQLCNLLITKRLLYLLYHCRPHLWSLVYCFPRAGRASLALLVFTNMEETLTADF